MARHTARFLQAASARPTLQTVDIALFGTLIGVIIAVPLAVLAAANVTPSRFAYYAARAIIGFTRRCPIWYGRCYS